MKLLQILNEAKIPKEIDSKISAKYNIGTYGLYGMQIHGERKVIKVFNNHTLPKPLKDKKEQDKKEKELQYLNWKEAVEWAQKNQDQIKESLLKEAKETKHQKEIRKHLNKAFEGLFNLDIELSNSYIGDSNSENDKAVDEMRKAVRSLISKEDKKYKVLFDFITSSKTIEKITSTL